MAFIFGVVVAGAIGPIALLIFGTGAKQGLLAGAFAGLGAALADCLYALAAFSTGALVLPLLAAHERIIHFGGALLLFALGTWMLLVALKGSQAPAGPRPAAQAFLPTFLLTAMNPMTFVVFAGIVPQLPVAGALKQAAALALALAAGSAVVNIAIGAAGSAIGRALPGDGTRRGISAAAGLGVAAFGIAGLIRA